MRTLGRLALAAILLVAGVGHFVATEAFQAQVPRFMPNPAAVIYVSGVVELALGAALLVARARQPHVGLAAAVFFILIFPGNISQYLTHTPAFGLETDTARAIRLVFQPVLVALALWSTGGWRLVRRLRH